MDPNGEGYTPNFEGQDFQEEVRPMGQAAQQGAEGVEGQDFVEPGEGTEGQYFAEDKEDINQ